MSYLSAKSRRIQAQLANTKKHRPDDITALEERRREFCEARIADFIAKSLAEAPPLTGEQRERLAGLLAPSSAGGAAA